MQTVVAIVVTRQTIAAVTIVNIEPFQLNILAIDNMLAVYFSTDWKLLWYSVSNVQCIFF